MTWSLAIVLLVAAQRLGELAWSHANAARMRVQGGIEVGQAHYWPLIGVHVLWLASLLPHAAQRPIDPLWLGAYLLLQVARAWVLASLGRRWTTRVIVLPGAPLVRSGPYRWLRHPNYVVLAAEVAVLPLVFHLWIHALVFSLLNGIAMAVRLRCEAAALAPRRAA